MECSQGRGNTTTTSFPNYAGVCDPHFAPVVTPAGEGCAAWTNKKRDAKNKKKPQFFSRIEKRKKKADDENALVLPSSLLLRQADQVRGVLQRLLGGHLEDEPDVVDEGAADLRGGPVLGRHPSIGGGGTV